MTNQTPCKQTPPSAKPATVCVLLAPHPFTAHTQQHDVPAGLTVADILRQLCPDTALAKHIHADLNGYGVPPGFWPRLRPKAGTVLRFTLVPMGGGGSGSKNPLRTVLSLAMIAASPLIAGTVAGILGPAAEGTFLGINLGRLVATGVNLVSRLALNALAPPGRPRLAGLQKESPTLFLQGARNQATPFGRVPRVLGKHRFVPPLGALPYTETVGDEQYLRMLFIWGYGPLRIGELKIGETPIEAFEDIEIETRQGYADDAPITLYTDSVLQNDLQIALKNSDGYALRTTEAAADEISVDVTLPHGLLTFDGSGGRAGTSVTVEVQYAPTGTSDWSAPALSYTALAAATVTLDAAPQVYRYAGVSHVTRRCDLVVMDAASGAVRAVKGVETRDGIDAETAPRPLTPSGSIALAAVSRHSDEVATIDAGDIADLRAESATDGAFESAGDFTVTPDTGKTLAVAAGGLSFSGITLTGKQTAAIRRNVSFKVARGQYDVRLRRVTPDATDDNTFDDVAWTALRTIRYAAPVAMQGLAMTALRIKATDQLNGVVDRFNGVVQSILPDWDGAAWTEQPTANPAALYRYILQGDANARPLEDSRLDLDRITAWHDDCALAGREYNGVVDYDAAVRDVLRDVAAAGRASPALLDGKWSVVEDKPQAVPVQHFTPRNSYNFQGQKSFDAAPHALRVRFINRDKGWLQDERLVYDDGYDAQNATRYETLELPGVTSAAQAWQDGRYHIATARLRPETYSFSCDIEHIVCTRGDLIRFTHDVPLFGLVSARVNALGYSEDLSHIINVTLDAPVTMEAGKKYALRFRTDTGASIVVIAATIAGTDAQIVVSPSLAADCGLKAGDLAVFGESGQESVEMIVKSIVPQGDLGARLTCIDAAPAVHDAGDGTIPAFDSHITIPPEMRRPPAPVLSNIQSGAEALIRNTDGSLTTRILVTLKNPEWSGALTPQVTLRAADESGFRVADMTAQGATRLSITDVAEGETYDIRIRYITAAGSVSDALTVAGHRVEGTTALPADVRNLSVNILGDTAHLSWDKVADIDLDHYSLRFSPLTTGAAWSNAVDLVSHVPMDATAVAVAAAEGTYLLKAVDIGGRLSANAAAVASSLSGISGYNAVLTATEDPDFTGAAENMIVSGGSLRLGGQDTVDDWTDWDAVDNADIGQAGLATSGSYVFSSPADLGSVYTARVTAGITLYGFDFNGTLDSWGDLDLVEVFDQDVDPALWSLTLQVRTTQDDPADAGAAWTGWTPFVAGDYTARGFSFRLAVTTLRNNITPAITALSVQIDMPDRIASAGGLLSGAGGTDVSFALPFRAAPALAVTPHDMAAGDYYSVTAKTESGFHIRFYDDTGAGVARHFDYMAQGYGAQI